MLNRMSTGAVARRIIFTEQSQLSIAAPVDGKPVTLTGYALVWNVLSTDRGGYKVRLLPGSATFAPLVHALFHHEYRDVLGCNENGTLRIMPDDYGVKVEIDLANTNAGRDVAELVRRKDIKGMSFAMIDAPKSTKSVENGVTILNASSFIVDEVTVTAIPAFTDSIVTIKPQPDVPAYADRTAQAHRLNRFKLDLLRLGQSPAAVRL